MDVNTMNPVEKIGEKKVEEIYVHDFYDTVSVEWSSTRYKSWPNVVRFLNICPPNTITGDIGCGNGKNIFSAMENGKFVISMDYSISMLNTISPNIRRKQDSMEKSFLSEKYDLLAGDITNCPFRSSFFDQIICIAVLHHLTSVDRRLLAIKEMHRVLKIGGKILIYVWAFEQSEDSRRQFSSHDCLIPWKNKTRYIHLYIENELRDLITSTNLFIIEETYYDKGNWCVIAKSI
jgi:ubiquinone/menaquinone biosynthesis C-methylase UbiE